VGYQYDGASAALRPSAAVNGAVLVFRDPGAAKKFSDMTETAKQAATSKILRAIGIELLHRIHDGHVDSRAMADFANVVIWWRWRRWPWWLGWVGSQQPP
jgi:hypothetical protein